MLIDRTNLEFQPADCKTGAIFLINKPLEWTSFDVVNKLRYAIKRKTGKIKVGHAGTLDPKATGLLILCTGKATKNIQQYQDLSKEYVGTFFLGASTPSFDTETEIDQQFETKHLNNELLSSASKAFVGEIEQVPPIFSAIKKEGIAAYHYARKGTEIKLEPRTIRIDEFEILNINLPVLSFRVKCSKGTYIRSLASDFGKKVNSGAYLSSLCRTRIGNFSVDDAFEIDQLVSYIDRLDKIKSISS